MTAISNKVINRLTLYHCLLKYTFSRQLFISSFEIADLLDLNDSLVRKDIALCGVLGHKKNGYITAELQSAIEKKLGFSERKEVFIIGAGNLGTALVNYADFKDYGIDVLALFDIDPDKIGKEIAKKKGSFSSQIRKFNFKNKYQKHYPCLSAAKSTRSCRLCR